MFHRAGSCGLLEKYVPFDALPDGCDMLVVQSELRKGEHRVQNDPILLYELEYRCLISFDLV